MTISRTKRIFLKRPIYKIPCIHEGCKIILHTRSFNRKRCHKHGANAKYKISKRSLDKRKDMNSPYYVKPKKIRECLKCGKQFESLSDSNRVCNSCNNENDVLRGTNTFHGWKLMRKDHDPTLKYYDFKTSTPEWLNHNT